MSRIGKIARLPDCIREETNVRLKNGESGVKIIEWLNAQPETQKVVAGEFKGRPINPPNLTAWKQSGYQDWLQKEERYEFVQRLVEHGGGVKTTTHTAVGDLLSMTLSVELGKVSREMLQEAKNPKEKWERLSKVLDRLDQLRRGDHRMLRLAGKFSQHS